MRLTTLLTYRCELLLVNGIREGSSLTGAPAIPLNLNTDHLFPQRDLTALLTFCVILTTLVGQGLSLPAMISCQQPHGCGSEMFFA